MFNIKKPILILAAAAGLWAGTTGRAGATSAATLENAAAGPYPGTVIYSWTVNDTMVQGNGDKFYIQHTTSPAAVIWSKANAQLTIATSAVGGTMQSVVIGGLNTGRSGAGTIESPAYTFKIWVETMSVLSPVSAGSPAVQPNTPPLPLISAKPYEGGALLLEGNTRDYAQDSYGYGGRMAVDPQNNVYLVDTLNTCMACGGTEIVLRKYDTAGALQWLRLLNSASPGGLDYGRAVAVNPANGDIYITGSLYNGANGDIMAAKYAADGELKWLFTRPGTAGNDRGQAIAFDTFSGDVYAGGYFTQTSTTSADTWLARIPAAGGNPVWERIYNSTRTLNTEDFISGLALDAAGNIYTGGQASNSSGYADMQIARYDASGTRLAVMDYNSPGNSYDSANGIAVDPAGYAYLCGYEERNDLNQNRNLILRKYDLALSTSVWTRTYDNPNTAYTKNEGAYNCAVDKFGGIYVAGYEWRMDLSQNSNALYFKYTADGQLVSTRTYASAGDDAFYDVALSTVGNVLLAGQFGDSYGFYSFPQAGGSPSQLGAYAGAYTGSVQLNWNYPQAVAPGTHIYVQYSASPSFSWSTATAQVDITTGPVAAGTPDGYLVRGLPASRDAWGKSTTPNYYFRVWLDAAPMGAPVSAQARTPALNDVINVYPQARLTYSENWSMEFATAMDGSGNIYQAYNLMSAASMEGGWALRKYDKAGGRYEWTRFYNSTAPGVSASYEINALAIDAAGNFYVAGKENTGPTVFDAFVVKIYSDGALAWARTYNGTANDIDAFYAVAVDTAGAVYAGGQEYAVITQMNALLRKYDAAGAVVWTQIFPWSGGMGNAANGLALYGGAVYVTGQKGVSPTDSDIFLRKYNQADGGLLWAAPDHGGPQPDGAYGLAVDAAGYIYVAGKLYAANEDAWLGKYRDNGPSGALVLASTYNSSGNGMDANYGVTLYGGELYTAGWEMRTDLFQMDNMRVTKVDPATLNTLWTKTFDGGSSERAKNVMLDGPAVFAAASYMSRPGIYLFLPPSFNVGGLPGAYPGTAEINWTSPYDLAAGSTYYFQASSYSVNMPWNYNNAQTIFFTTGPVSSGMYQSYNIGGLDASRGAAGVITSPNYYFKVWAYNGSYQALAGLATAYANTPAVQDSVVTYPDSKVWSINNSYGWRNKSARDASGNLYTVFNTMPGGGMPGMPGMPGGGGMFVLRKYLPNMTTAWTRFFSGRPGENLQAFAVTVSRLGNIIVAGSRGSWEAPAKNDIMAVNYNAAGQLLWSRNYDYGYNNDDGYGVTTDDAGNIYLAGSVTRNAGGRHAFVLKTGPDGVAVSSIALSGTAGAGWDEASNIVFDSTKSVVYVSGKLENSGTGSDAFVTKLSTSPLVALSTAVITGNGNNWDQGGGLAVDGLGGVYAAASVNNGMVTGSDIWVGKLDGDANLASVWTQSYNDPANGYDTAGNVTLDSMGGVYVTGSESRWDINQGDNLFIRKFGSAAGDIIWTRSFNGAGSSYERGWDIHVDAAGYVYATGEFNGAFGVYRYRQLIFSNSNPLLSVYITSGSAGAYAGGVPVVIMPFDQSGGVNPELMVIGSASASGYFSARLPAGMQYFVGISTPGFKPTIKDQLMDPYGSFMVNLTGDATKQYRLYRKNAAEPGHTLNVFVSSGLVAGDYLMGEVFYSKNGDKAAYGIARSTSFNTAITLHNVPPADGGVYGFNISVPGKNKATMLYLSQAFPGVSNYTVDMTSAVAMVGYTAGGSTTPPSFQAVVRSTWGAPIDGTRVELSKWASDGTTDCSGAACWKKVIVYENLTDINGRAVFSDIQRSTGSYQLEIKKQGYSNYRENGDGNCSMLSTWGICVSTPGYTVTRDYMLALATYTLTGVVKYNGVPLPNANVMVNGDFNWVSGSDSYSKQGNAGIRTDARVKTGADGSFTITGLTDGNARLNAEFMGNWRELNSGNDMSSSSDNLRVTISSDSAIKPASPLGNSCLPGRVWVLDSSGNCLAADNLQFNLAPTGANALGALYGSLTFVTTYTVTEASPLEIPASSPVVVMAIQDCDGDCPSRQLGFASFAGTLTSDTTAYAIALSSGVDYRVKIYSTEWGMLSSFNDGVGFISTNTVEMDFTLTRAGGLKGQLKFPDGANFKPNYSTSTTSPDYYAADIELRGKTVQFNDGTGVDQYGAFEYPNVPPGIYDIHVKPRGDAFRWPPADLEGVSVSVGETTEVKLTLEDGLVVQPQIFGLPEISTPAWTYRVIGVPSGFAMTQRNITETFFDRPQYYFNYSADDDSWDEKYMAPGQYDFYLTVGAKYECTEPGGSCEQFANFIGQVRGLDVKESDTSPGTLDQPIPVNILGSVGPGSMAGRITGGKIFTDPDFERIFANFEAEIMPLIPAVMLYDMAGDLKGFGHAVPDKTAIGPFMNGIYEKDKSLVKNSLVNNPLRYLVWGMPPGRYTAVFVNPNYPPVAKEIQLPQDENYNFNFDAQSLVVGGISGVVKSSATGEALANARVYLKHRILDKFTVTDSSGAFTFVNLPAGIYRLEITKDGFVKIGRKTGLAGSDEAVFKFFMAPTEASITGKVYLGKFPSPSTAQGIKLVAYDETLNVESPAAYLPKIEAQTAEDGSYELTGIIMGHVYKVSAFLEGKLPVTLEVTALDVDTVVDDIVLRDVPPQVKVKVRKSPDSASKVDVIITSPKELVTTPSCRYNPGEVYTATSAVSLMLIPGANNSYLGQFTVSSNRQFYTIYVAAGDGDNRMEKNILYDQTNDAKTEQYIQDAAIAGGEIMMDQETEEYSGLELDAGGITASSGTADFSDLIGGFFSSLPSVRTVKTAKGNASVTAAIQSLMASEVYNMDLSNSQPNKPFTLTLKYDKERALNTAGLRIYQYDDATGSWKEIPGDYTVDPMTGVVSVDVSSLGLAYEGGGGETTPLGRKRFGMSAVVNGRYAPSAAGSSSQTGKFAVFTAKPPTGTAAFSASFEVYNMPNPFSLKSKNVALNATDIGISGIANPYSTKGTVIKYNLPAGKSGNLKFVIYNIAGEKVRTIDEGARTGGYLYYSEWDGKNDTGQNCASGVYFMLTYVDGKKLGVKAHKMAIIK